MEIKYIKDILVKRSKTYPNYGVSECGRAFRWERENELKVGFLTGGEYPTFRVSHSGKAFSPCIHRVVAECWLVNPNPDILTEVNHIDGDKTNYKISNLEWVSKSQNMRHAVNTGLKSTTVNLYNSGFKCDLDVHLACYLLSAKTSVAELSERFGVSKGIILKLRSGSTYFKIRKLYNIENEWVKCYPNHVVEEVCELIVEGHSDLYISKTTSVVVIDVKRIREKIRYKEISKTYF